MLPKTFQEGGTHHRRCELVASWCPGGARQTWLQCSSIEVMMYACWRDMEAVDGWFMYFMFI